MISKQDILAFYDERRVPNSINVTLTFKQYAEGQWLTREAADQNVRHFRNLLNRHLFGNAYKRFGKQLAMFVVHEGTTYTRHHIHGVIECPDGWDAKDFMKLVIRIWTQTRFGYTEHHYEVPATTERESGWVHYCLKKRTKLDFVASVDWENSPCFERR